MSILRDYFQTGQWKDQYEDLPDADLASCLEIPEFALRPIWDGKDFTKPLTQTFGWTPAKFMKAGRVALDRLLKAAEQSGRVTPYESACARLVFESVGPGTRQVFPEGDHAARVQWVRGFAQKDFGPIKGVNPLRILRIATIRDWQLKTDPDIRMAVSRSALGALGQLKPGEPLSQDVQIRLALIRHHVLNIECEDPEPDAREWMSQAGIEPARIAELVAVIRDEKPIDPLFSFGGQVNLRVLMDRPEFKEAAAFYGFLFDPSRIEKEREMRALLDRMSDPWCRLLVNLALRIDDRGVRALACLAQLGVARESRDAVMKSLVESDLLPAADAKSVVAAELRPHGHALHQRVFQALAVARFDQPDAVFRQMLQETGFEGWFERSFDAYCASTAGAAVPGFPPELRRKLKEVGHVARRSPAISDLADELEQAGGAFDSERERDEAEQAGRGWFYDYAQSCVEIAQSQYDRGSGIFQDSDRAKVLEALQRRRSRMAAWWRVPMDPATEMRICEASVHYFGNEAYEGHLEGLARTVAAKIHQAVPSSLKSHAKIEIDACARFVVNRDGAVREEFLRAFRAGSASDFVGALEGEDIDLPPLDRPRVRVLGRRVAAYGAIFALLPLILLVRIVFASPAKDPPPTPTGEPRPVGLPLDVSKRPWSTLGEGRFALRVGLAEFSECFGSNPGGSEADSLPLVTQSLSMQFVARFELLLKRNHSLGVAIGSAEDPPLAWEKFEVRLPTSEEASALSPSTGIMKVPIWLDGGQLSSIESAAPRDLYNPFKLGQLYVIIRRR